jgi:hypothetical protein
MDIYRKDKENTIKDSGCDRDHVSGFNELLPNNCKVVCQCCVQLISVKSELQEIISELKSAREIINILREQLDITYTSDLNNVNNKCLRTRPHSRSAGAMDF